MQDLKPFFEETHFIESKGENFYSPLQWGANIIYPGENFNWDEADIVLLGCGERRGEGSDTGFSQAPDKIREQLYQLYNWHPSVKVADVGNIRQGLTVDDTRAALRTVLGEIKEAGKI